MLASVDVPPISKHPLKVDVLCSSLYHPQNPKEVADAHATLVKSIGDMLTVFPSHPGYVEHFPSLFDTKNVKNNTNNGAGTTEPAKEDSASEDTEEKRALQAQKGADALLEKAMEKLSQLKL